MSTDPWTFGWTQVISIAGHLLTLIGIGATATIAIVGLRTFKRWRREKLEETLIEVAFETLSIAYESKFVFDDIRQRLIRSPEYEDMPRYEHESDKDREGRQSYYAVHKRIERHAPFFESALKLLPRYMAVFGRTVEEEFLKVFVARDRIYEACNLLSWDLRDVEPGDRETQQLVLRLRRELYGGSESEPDAVTNLLDDFTKGIEQRCRPVVDREIGQLEVASLARSSIGVVEKVVTRGFLGT
jgi:hypothetical protein